MGAPAGQPGTGNDTIQLPQSNMSSQGGSKGTGQPTQTAMGTPIIYGKTYLDTNQLVRNQPPLTSVNSNTNVNSSDSYSGNSAVSNPNQDNSFYSGRGLGSNNAPVESMGSDTTFGSNVAGGYGAGGYNENDNFGGFGNTESSNGGK